MNLPVARGAVFDLMAAKEKHPHYGHRKRLKDEILATGIESKPPHEVLEAFLFYAIPNGDTNPIAHRLIQQFGSLNAVLNAPYDELIQVSGIKEHAASMICFFRMLSKVYLTAIHSESLMLNSYESLFQYCKALFIGAALEEIHCIFFDDQLNLMGEEKLCDGTFGKVRLSLRTVAEAAIMTKSNRLALAHNHPNGSCFPSKNDLNATVEIWKMLKSIEIELVDHVIVGRDGEWSMRYNHTLPQIWRD